MNNILTNLKDVKEVVGFALDHLGIDGVTITITENAKLLRRLSQSEYEYEALLHKGAVEHSYNLIVKSDCPKWVALCHEAVHLKQYEDGRLHKDSDGNAIWQGVIYTNATPYDKRPWEQEAFILDASIVKAYKKARKAK